MNRILVIKLADIGDVLTATPALRSLRRTFRGASITALVSPHCASLLEGTGLVDEVLTLDPAVWRGRPPVQPRAAVLHVLALRRRRFDAMILLHHLTTAAGAARYAALAAAVGAPVRAGLENGRGWFLTHRAPDLGFGTRHEVEYCSDVTALLGAPPDRGPLVFPLSQRDRRFAEASVPSGRPRVALHPGTGGYSLARRWPTERYTEAARHLAAGGASIVVVGGPGEEPMGRQVAAAAGPEAVDLSGKTSLSQLGAVLEGCDVFLGNDSGVMHVAAAVGTPVVAVFGPSNDRAWGPWSPDGRSVVLRAALPCSPCFYRGHELGTPQGCPNRTCLDLVPVDQVVGAVQEMIAAGAPQPRRPALAR